MFITEWCSRTSVIPASRTMAWVVMEQARLEQIRLGNSRGLSGSGKGWGWDKDIIPGFNDLVIIGLTT